MEEMVTPLLSQTPLFREVNKHESLQKNIKQT